MKMIAGGVTAAKGFEAASAAAGIKYQGRDDMALIYSAAPCVAAGTFTSNVVKAAPVIWDRELIAAGGPVHAAIVNSGIANACTGEEGMRYCRQTAEEAGERLGIPADSVLVASTGVIGFQLPMDRVREGVRLLSEARSDSEAAAEAASRAIMTTDTVNKQFACRVDADGCEVTIGGMAKGSGMIHPNMCTMLSFVTTDAAIDKELLQKAVSAIVDDTFNMISVDGDTSTNDTFVVMANGQAGNRPITEEGKSYDAFCEGLRAVCRALAMALAGDGEGAGKLIESRVEGADTRENARTLAKSVITSSLTKAAVFGCDANWGRVLCALGYSGAQFDPDKVDLYFSDGEREILIFTKGSAADYSEEEATQILKSTKVIIRADMHMGDVSATAWGCDLTYDYVKINADYRS